MPPKRPAVDAAVRFLQAGVRSGIFREGDRLPTIIDLARQAGVSKVSMTKGVQMLASEGLLDVRRKRGIVLTRGRPDAVPIARAPSKANVMAQDVVRKLLAGTYRSYVLPSLKELQASYGAGFRGVKRLVESLRREGIVVPHGRGYRLRGPAPGPRPKTLVFVVGRDFHENLALSYARSFFYPLLYALERTCSRRNVRLEVIRPPWRWQEFVHKRDTLAHFVALDTEPDAPTIRLISHLLTLGAPVLVFRDTDHEAFRALPSSKALVFFDCSNRAAGAHVGRYLLAMGHRRVCFLRRSPPEPWSVERLAGLVRAFDFAGEHGGVTVLDVGAPGGTWRGSGRLPRRTSREAVAQWKAKILSLLATPVITAWVASDDHLVFNRIVPALRSRGLVLGQGASIVSFNDQAEAFDYGLTSYDFDGPSLAAAVLSHALIPSPVHRAQRARHRVVEVEGYLVDRGSVRAIPR